MKKYVFENKNLYNQALIHSSITGDACKNYERLEFLGDRVLGLCVATMLYENFGVEPEGSLSQRLMGLVCKETVAKVALKLGLDKEMKTTNKELLTSENVLCDVLEAVIGALYLDGGFDNAFDFVKENFYDLIFENIAPPKDLKSTLQELSVAKGLGMPVYEIIGKSGSEHEPIYEIEVKVLGLPNCVGKGKNKKAAQFEAAKKMLEALNGA
ncbi:MAG: ribonuclease III [Alphaproteobacteria bacterium]